ALRPIKIAADIMAGVAGEENLFDGVLIAIDLAMNNRIEGSLLRHRPQSRRDEDTLAYFFAAGFPCFLACRRREGEVAVKRSWFTQPAVGKVRVGLQQP